MCDNRRGFRILAVIPIRATDAALAMFAVNEPTARVQRVPIDKEGPIDQNFNVAVGLASALISKLEDLEAETVKTRPWPGITSSCIRKGRQHRFGVSSAQIADNLVTRPGRGACTLFCRKYRL
jgi:hypothetical protein